MRPTGCCIVLDSSLKHTTGWTEIVHLGPLGIGYFGRLESGLLYRGAKFPTPLKGWWWRPTLAGINFKLDREAVENPIPRNVAPLRGRPACPCLGCCDDAPGGDA